MLTIIQGLLDNPTFDQILQFIVDARRRNADSIITFHRPAELVRDLDLRLANRMRELDLVKIRRFEYDYESEVVYIDIKLETSLHAIIAQDSGTLAVTGISNLIPTINDAAIRLRLKGVINRSTSRINVHGKILKQPDWALGCVTDKLPSLVCEVS